MKCKYCNFENADGTRYCENCGASLETSSGVMDDMPDISAAPVQSSAPQQSNDQSNSYGYGQTNNGYGQPNNGYGQPNNGYGQPNNGYGQPNNGYGQPNNGYGQPNNGYGQPNNGYGQPNNGYGQQKSEKCRIRRGYNAVFQELCQFQRKIYKKRVLVRISFHHYLRNGSRYDIRCAHCYDGR